MTSSDDPRDPSASAASTPHSPDRDHAATAAKGPGGPINPPMPPTKERDLAACADLRNAAKLCLGIGAISFVLPLGIQIANGATTYSFNVGLLLAAALLWSCNLRAASLVRWAACLYLGTAIYVLFAIVRQPLDLTLSYLRLYPVQSLIVAVVEVLTWLACLDLVRRLGSDAILRARAAAGKRQRNMRIPLVIGCLASLCGVVFAGYLLSGPRVERAEALARQSKGAGYRYYTEGMNLNTRLSGNGGKSQTYVNASVAVWDKEIVYHLPVRWIEP